MSRAFFVSELPVLVSDARSIQANLTYRHSGAGRNDGQKSKYLSLA